MRHDTLIIMVSWEATHPAVTLMGTWGSKSPTVLVSLSGVGVIMELLVLQSLSMRPGQSSCGLLVLPQEDFPAQDSSACRVVHRHVFYMAAGGFVQLLLLDVCMCVVLCVCGVVLCVCMCVYVHVCFGNLPPDTHMKLILYT